MKRTHDDLPVAVDDDGEPLPLSAAAPAIVAAPVRDESGSRLENVAGVVRGDWVGQDRDGRHGVITTPLGKIVAKLVIGVLTAAIVGPVVVILVRMLTGLAQAVPPT